MLRSEAAFPRCPGRFCLDSVLRNPGGLDDKINKAGNRAGLILLPAALDIHRDIEPSIGIEPVCQLLASVLPLRDRQAFYPVQIDSCPDLCLHLVDVLTTRAR